MYAKVNGSTVIEFPIYDIRERFPNISFPAIITDSNLPSGYVVVHTAYPPTVDHTKIVNSGMPIKDGSRWIQGWDVSEKSAEELAYTLKLQKEQAEQNRAAAYQLEADPIFFKFQRGEVEKQTWLDKVEEIKTRYPYPA